MDVEGDRFLELRVRRERMRGGLGKALAHVRGAYLLSLHRHELGVREYAPAEIKKALTGHGVASKEQVRAMVGRLLGAAELPASMDASDALAIAISKTPST